MMTFFGNLVLLACFLNLQQAHTVHSCQCVFNPRWPPTDPGQLRDPKTGNFDVRVNPLITTASLRSDALKRYVEGLKKRYRGPKIQGSLLYQAVLMHQKLKGGNGLGEYDYYPQPVDHFKILAAVRKGLPLEEAPKHDFPLNIIRHPKTCPQTKHKYHIVFLIQSCVQCANARQHSRRTYLKESLWREMIVGYAFVLGKPAKTRVKYLTVRGIRLRQPPSYPAGTNPRRLWKQLLAESDKHRDMLIGDFEDGMFSYTRNYILAIRWASIFCNKKTDLFALVDGRYTVFPVNFARWVKRTPRKQKLRMYGGLVLKRQVSRKSGDVDQVSVQEYPYRYYPTLVNAGFILLGHDTVQESSILTAFTQYLRNVGGYVATVNRKLRIHPKRIHGVHITVPGRNAARGALAGMAQNADRYINWQNGKVK